MKKESTHIAYSTNKSNKLIVKQFFAKKNYD